MVGEGHIALSVQAMHTLSTCVWSFFVMMMTPSHVNKEWRVQNIMCTWQQDLWHVFSYSRPEPRRTGAITQHNDGQLLPGRIYTEHLTLYYRAAGYSAGRQTPSRIVPARMVTVNTESWTYPQEIHSVWHPHNLFRSNPILYYLPIYN